LKTKFAKRIEKGSIHPPLLNLGQILTLTSRKIFLPCFHWSRLGAFMKSFGHPKSLRK